MCTVQNIFVGIERLSDEELKQVRAKCEVLAKAEDREVEKIHSRANEAAEKA